MARAGSLLAFFGHWQMSFTLCFYLFSVETSEADKKSRSLKEFLERLDFVISTKDRLQQGFEPLFGPFISVTRARHLNPHSAPDYCTILAITWQGRATGRVWRGVHREAGRPGRGWSSVEA
jgi:hypothetical protein